MRCYLVLGRILSEQAYVPGCGKMTLGHYSGHTAEVPTTKNMTTRQSISGEEKSSSMAGSGKRYEIARITCLTKSSFLSFQPVQLSPPTTMKTRRRNLHRPVQLLQTPPPMLMSIIPHDYKLHPPHIRLIRRCAHSLVPLRHLGPGDVPIMLLSVRR
jgi:hypothetical protein